LFGYVTALNGRKSSNQGTARVACGSLDSDNLNSLEPNRTEIHDKTDPSTLT